MDTLRIHVIVIFAVALVFILLNELFRAMNLEITITGISYMTFILGYAIASKLPKVKE